MEKIVMPKHLKIITGVIIIGVILRGTMIFWQFKSMTSITSQIVPDLLGIIISLGLIRGFYYRSKLAWQFAIGVTLLGLIGLLSMLVIFLKLSGPSYQSILIMFLIGTILECYFLWVLFSKEVRYYFTRDNLNNIPGC